MNAAATKLAKEVAVVTKSELLELSEWERKYADAKKKASAAEKELAFRRQALAEKTLGIATADELKQLSPEKLEKLLAKRFDSGDWKAERNAPVFAFVQTSSGRYPAWAKLFASEVGETAANRIKAETATVYSYCVEVAVLA
jgi:hypothetical protein